MNSWEGLNYEAKAQVLVVTPGPLRDGRKERVRKEGEGKGYTVEDGKLLNLHVLTVVASHHTPPHETDSSEHVDGEAWRC